MKRINSFLEYLLAFLIALDYYSVYFANQLLGIGRTSLIIILLVLLGCMLTQKQRKTINLRPLLLFLTVLFVLFVSNGGGTRLFLFAIHYLILLPLLFFYFSNQDKESNMSLLFKYSNVVTCIGGFYLFIWLMVSIFGIVKTNMSVPDNDWGEFRLLPSYNFLYFETQSYLVLGREFIRNSAIFEEPPVYNFVLCVALGIEVFLKKTRNSMHILILTLSILSTITVTGQIFLLATLVCWFLQSGKKSAKIKMLSRLLLPFIVVFAYISIKSILEEKASSHSYETRTDTLKMMLNNFTQNPFLGIGYKRYKGEVSNSMMHLLAEGGLAMAFVYLTNILIAPIMNWIRTHETKWVLFISLYFMLFFVTIGYDNLINIMMIAFTMAYFNRNVKSKIQLQ